MLKAKVTSKEYTYARRGVEVITAKKGDELLGEDAEIAINAGNAKAVTEDKEPEKSTKDGADKDSGDDNGDDNSSDGEDGDNGSDGDSGDESEGSGEDGDPELSEGNGKKPEENKPAKSPTKKK